VKVVDLPFAEIDKDMNANFGGGDGRPGWRSDGSTVPPQPAIRDQAHREADERAPGDVVTRVRCDERVPPPGGPGAPITAECVLFPPLCFYPASAVRP
jgi:hypothetical protein